MRRRKTEGRDQINIGNLELGSISRPFGTWILGRAVPNAEALGYCRLSLRDRDCASSATQAGSISINPFPERRSPIGFHPRSVDRDMKLHSMKLHSIPLGWIGILTKSCVSPQVFHGSIRAVPNAEALG